MNVLVCSAARFGIANVVYNVIEKMEPLDVEVTYCRNPLNPSPKWCETVDLLNKDFYERLSSTIENTVVYRPVHLSYGILWYWRKAFKYIERHGEKYDVVWLHSPHPVIFKRYSDCSDNFMITLHNNPRQDEDRDGLDEYYYHFIKTRQEQILRMDNIELITGVGPRILSELRDRNIPDEKLIFVGNGVDISKFSQTTHGEDLKINFEIPSSHIVLLYLSRFTEQKRPRNLLETFVEIKQQKNDISLIMAGEGELLSDSKEFVRSVEIDDVYFPGFVSEKEKVRLYRSTDLFILPSKYEGGYPPLVLAEAMAAGTPCIVSQIKASDFVLEADCGISVDFEAPKKAAYDIVEYISSDFSKDGSNARKFAVSNFSWESITNIYLEKINERFIHRCA